MVIVMKQNATRAQLEAVCKHAESHGFSTNVSRGEECTVVGLVGDRRSVDPSPFQLMDGVARAIPVLEPYTLASRNMHPDGTHVSVGSVEVGNSRLWVVAGPCSVESREQIIETACAVREAGATALRGGAFKPRSSPYSFQGLGVKGLELLVEARERTGLPFVTEVMGITDLDVVAEHADVLQIGARNMQNFNLLRAVGRQNKPVLLKRGMMCTLEELLMSAEYIISQGNLKVILCERGIRTFETYTRNTLDINAVPVLKQRTHLPVIVDPSHATGFWNLVEPTARAAVAAGADGLMIEVHPDPPRALSDGGQSLKPERFADLMKKVRAISHALGRTA